MNNGGECSFVLQRNYPSYTNNRALYLVTERVEHIQGPLFTKSWTLVSIFLPYSHITPHRLLSLFLWIRRWHNNQGESNSSTFYTIHVMNPTSPIKDSPSPGISRTTAQTTLLDHFQSTPKASSGGGFLSRRRGDSDGAGKSSATPLVSFGNGTPVSRPTSSPSSGGGGTTATVLV